MQHAVIVEPTAGLREPEHGLGGWKRCGRGDGLVPHVAEYEYCGIADSGSQVRCRGRESVMGDAEDDQIEAVC